MPSVGRWRHWCSERACDLLGSHRAGTSGSKPHAPSSCPYWPAPMFQGTSFFLTATSAFSGKMKDGGHKRDVTGAKLPSPKRPCPTLGHLFEGGVLKGREGVTRPEQWGASWTTGLPGLPRDPSLGSHQLGKQEPGPSKGREHSCPSQTACLLIRILGKRRGKPS